MKFTKNQIERYSRQIVLNEVGKEGQKKILRAKVLIIGCGGLGSAAAYYLAGGGVGKIGLVDSEKVTLSNLQRQILHYKHNIGEPKVKSAKKKLCELNPDVRIKTYSLRLNSTNAKDIINEYDFMLDCSDNLATRYLVNDACIKSKKPFSHAGVLRFEGLATTVIPRKGPCYRCIFPSPPPYKMLPGCKEAGILGPAAGLLGTIQANETIKYILGIGELLVGKLLVINMLKWDFQLIKTRKNRFCPVCGEKKKN